MKKERQSTRQKSELDKRIWAVVQNDAVLLRSATYREASSFSRSDTTAVVTLDAARRLLSQK